MTSSEKQSQHQEKKTYSAPKLQVYGSLTDITNTLFTSPNPDAAPMRQTS